MAVLRMNKSNYAVGERPVYTITGAEPGAVIAWSSFKDGETTGEFQAQYGQRVGANGSWSEMGSQPWNASHIGQWQKQVLLVNQDGSFDQAQVNFTVGGSGGNDFEIGDFFSGSIDLPGLGSVPNIALIAGGALLFLMFSGKRGR